MNAKLALRPLSDLVEVQKEKVDPSQMAGSLIEHYSLPAFDAGWGPEVVEATEIKSTKTTVPDSALLVSRLNPHIPRVWRVKRGALPALASTEFAVLTPRAGIALGYLQAVMQSADVKDLMNRRVTGTSTSHQRVKVEDLLSIRVPLLPAERQEQIAELAESIDARESATRAVSGLVGRLVDATFARFLPHARKSAAMSDIASITAGVSYRSEDLMPSEAALLTLKCFGRRGEYREVGLKGWAGEPKPDQTVQPGDLVIAITDLTQAADVLGAPLVVRRSPVYRQLAASLDVAVVRSTSDVSREWLYAVARHRKFKEYCRSHATGTTVLHLPKRSVAAYEVPILKPDRAGQFDEIVRPLLEREAVTTLEAAKLQALRLALVERWFGRTL